MLTKASIQHVALECRSGNGLLPYHSSLLHGCMTVGETHSQQTAAEKPQQQSHTNYVVSQWTNQSKTWLTELSLCRMCQSVSDQPKGSTIYWLPNDWCLSACIIGMVENTYLHNQSNQWLCTYGRLPSSPYHLTQTLPSSKRESNTPFRLTVTNWHRQPNPCIEFYNWTSIAYKAPEKWRNSICSLNTAHTSELGVNPTKLDHTYASHSISPKA